MKNLKILSSLTIYSAVLFVACDESLQLESPANHELPQIAMGSTQITGQALVTDYMFYGTEGDPISLETAQAWTSNFRKDNSAGTQAHFFGHEIIKQILEEEACVGIRMYYALDEQGKRQIILVGVNSKGENLLPGSQELNEGDEYIVADASFPCPSFCPDMVF